MTGKPEDPVAENQDPLVVATWNGNFMRNTNGSGSVNYDELQKVFGKNSVMTMAGNTTGAMFETLSTTTNSNYPGLKLEASSDTYRWPRPLQLSQWQR